MIYYFLLIDSPVYGCLSLSSYSFHFLLLRTKEFLENDFHTHTQIKSSKPQPGQVKKANKEKCGPLFNQNAATTTITTAIQLY